MFVFSANIPVLFIVSDTPCQGSIQMNGAFGFDHTAKYGNSENSIVNSGFSLYLFYRLTLEDVIPFLIIASFLKESLPNIILLLSAIMFFAYSVPVNPSTKYKK